MRAAAIGVVAFLLLECKTNTFGTSGKLCKLQASLLGHVHELLERLYLLRGLVPEVFVLALALALLSGLTFGCRWSRKGKLLPVTKRRTRAHLIFQVGDFFPKLLNRPVLVH